jgi:hypothetical protein
MSGFFRSVGRAFRGVGRVLGPILGVVAAIAIPFVAGPVAAAIFGSSTLAATTATGAFLGAGAGAVSSALTGGNIGRGALLGGLGGGIAGFGAGGGFQSIFGGGAAAPAGLAAPGSLPPPVPVPTGVDPTSIAAQYSPLGAPLSGIAANGIPLPAPPTPTFTGTGIGSAAAPATTQAAPQIAGAAAQAAPQTFGERLLAGATSPAGMASIAQLGMTMFSRPPEGLTDAERAYVAETAGLAATNRELYEQRVAAARQLMQQGQANPEQAFAQASMGVQRGYREAGLRAPEERRRAAIAGSIAGTAAIPREFARASTATQAGLSALPTSAPAGPATYALAAQRDAERRREQYESDLARSVGSLAGALGGTRSSLFG